MKDLSLLDLNDYAVIETESGSVAFQQLGILVLDGSGSMVDELNMDKIPKGKAVSQAVRGVFNRFKDSRKEECFSFAVVAYDEKAKVVMDITEVKDINSEEDYNPTIGMGGVTYIYRGLEKAKEIADKFFAMPNPMEVGRSVVIVVLSDGLDMEEKETKRVLAQITKNSSIKVASCFFETLGAKKEYMDKCREYMEGLASEATLFQSVATIEGVRKFFTASVSGIISNSDERYNIT